MCGGRLPKSDRVRKPWGCSGERTGCVREKEWIDYVEGDVRAFGIAGDWNAKVLLEAGAWVETVTEGGRRFVAASKKKKKKREKGG